MTDNDVWCDFSPRLKPARGAEFSSDKAEGDTRADGVVTYSEVSVRPDNEVWRNLCPRDRGAEFSSDKAHRRLRLMAYFAYAEVAIEEQRSMAEF